MYGLAAEQQGGSDKSPQAALLKQLGLRVGDIPERTAAMVMTILGLPPKEAEAVARLPLTGTLSKTVVPLAS